MNETMTTDERQAQACADAPSPGARIAAAFSRDKAHLSDAEQRCLAGMIDRLVDEKLEREPRGDQYGAAFDALAGNPMKGIDDLIGGLR